MVFLRGALLTGCSSGCCPHLSAATSALDVFANAAHHSPAEAAKGLGMGAAVAAAVGQAAARSGGATPILLITGLALMLWASRGVLKAMRLVSSLAWSMRPSPLGSATRPTLATACVLMVFSLYGFVVAPLYRGSLPTDLVATGLAVVGIVTISVWAIGGLPHPEGIGWLASVPGAFLFAIGIEGLRLATTLYFAGKLQRVDRPLRSRWLRGSLHDIPLSCGAPGRGRAYGQRLIASSDSSPKQPWGGAMNHKMAHRCIRTIESKASS